MGLWQKVERPAPPTTTDYVEGEQKTSSIEDVEQKAQNLDIESDGSQPHHVHPDLERRVVMKLDLRVVPLVSALCSPPSAVRPYVFLF